MIVAKLINLALLGLFPLAWTAPLARAEISWLFTSEEISVLSGVRELWETDPLLSILVAAFAVAIPYLKTLALAYAQFAAERTPRWLPAALDAIGKLSMTDVFLIAFYILAHSGVSRIETAWGLYFFTALVFASMYAAWETKRALARRAG